MEKDIKIWLLEKWHAWEVQSREKRSEAQFDDQTILSILGYALPADSDDSPDQEMTRQKEELLYKYDQLSENDRQTILVMMEFLLSK